MSVADLLFLHTTLGITKLIIVSNYVMSLNIDYQKLCPTCRVLLNENKE